MSQTYYTIQPRLAAPTSVPEMMTDVIVALLPALAMSTYLYGWRVLLLAFLSVASCVVFQVVYGIVCHRVHPAKDPSPWLTGLLLAFCYPSSLPLWAVPFGSFFAIILVKELYGGLGCNFLNPALVGRMILASSPFLMTQFPQPLPMISSSTIDIVSTATPLAYLHRGELSPYTLEELFLGFHSGSLGEGSCLMLAMGGIYLLLRRVITPTVPLSFLGSVALIAFCFPPEGIEPSLWMFQNLWSGGLMLGAFFMATDPVTSPVSFQSQLVFGCGCGFLTMLLRNFGSYPEGVGFAILTMNGLVWLLDYLGAPRRFGARPFAVTEVEVQGIQEQIQSLRVIQPKRPSLNTVKKAVNPLYWGKKLVPTTVDGTVPGESYLDRLPNTAKSLLAYTMVLILTVGAISWTYTLTLLQTYRTEEARNQQLLSQAMPQADFMSETPYHSPHFTTLYASYQGQEHLGYCVELSASGFSGWVTLLVGVNLNGAVTGIAVLDHNETKDIGSKVLTSSALSRFYGRSGTLSLWGSNSVDVITGATVTLEAVTECVNRALQVVHDLDEAELMDMLHGTV